MEKKKPTQSKITKAFVDTLKFTSENQRYIYDRDLKGFGICIGKTKMTYFAEGTIRDSGGVTRRQTIGDATKITAEEARSAAREKLNQFDKGIDPKVELAKKLDRERQDRLRRKTLKEVWEAFREDRKNNRATNTIYHYGKYVEPAFGGKMNDRTGFRYADWHARPIAEITKEAAWDYHRLLKERSGPYYANGALRTLGTLARFAIKRGWLSAGQNPVDALRGEWFAESRRESTIPESKLGAWFKAVDTVRTGHAIQSIKCCCDYLEFLLLTGTRREEAAGLTWDRVDLAKKTVTFTKTKNGKDHALPTTNQLELILERRKIAADAINSAWTFPSFGRRKGTAGHICDPRFSQDEVIERSGVGFMLHDLRRTFITVASSRVSYPILKMLVNHSTKGDVTLGYIQPNAEERVKMLRQPMQELTNFFMLKKAEGQGMKLAVGQ